MTSFDHEREAFEHLKKNCSNKCREEYEQAVRTLVFRYNTAIYENRFVVGGVLEVFTMGLLRSVGIKCELVGDRATGGDILIQNEAMFSIKSSLVGINDIRLINQMGKGKRQWTTATLFIISHEGIVFGTPNMTGKSDLRASGDALVLSKKGLERLVSDKANVMSMNIPGKPSSKLVSSSKKASRAVAKQILYETNSKTLLSAVSPDQT